MKRFFVLMIVAVLMLGTVACSGGESQEEDTVKRVSSREEVENVTVIGEIVEVKIDPAYGDTRAATLFRVVGTEGVNHYFALGGIVDELEAGQQLEVKYTLEHEMYVYSDGSEKFSRTYGLYPIASTYEPKQNADGSISFERVDWGRPDEVTILPPSVPKTITVSK